VEEEEVGTYEKDIVVGVDILTADIAREWVIPKKISLPGFLDGCSCV